MWECEFSQTKEPWTVGYKKLLSCRGETPHQFFGDLKIEFFNPSSNSFDASGKVKKLNDKEAAAVSPKELSKGLGKTQESSYSNMDLRILETKFVGPQNIDVYVTGYKTGAYESVPFKITDGKSSVKINPMTWKIESVLSKGKPAKSFGPHPAQDLSLHYGYWILAGVIFLAALFLIIGALKKYLDRRSLLRELRNFEINGSGFLDKTSFGKQSDFSDDSYNQFSKSMRKIYRTYHSLEYIEKTKVSRPATDFYKDISKAFKLFITRRFLVPAYKWTYREVLSDIKKRHKKIYAEVSLNLEKIFYELDQVKEESIVHKDCQQLFKMSQNLVAQIKKVEGQLK